MRIVRTTLALALTLVVVGRASAATVSAKAISVSPSSVQGGALVTGTVTLTAAAPSGGASVSLESFHAAVTVPPSVWVPAGATTASFTFRPFATGSRSVAEIAATCGGVTKRTSLTIQPYHFVDISLSPASVPAGTTSTITVTFDSQVFNLFVTPSSSDPAVATVPSDVFVPAGSTSVSFAVGTYAVATVTPVTITVTDNPWDPTHHETRATTLTVTPVGNPGLVSVSLAATQLLVGASTTGTVTLSSFAPAGGATVALTSSDPALTVPASVTVPEGAPSVGFSASTTPVTTSATATVTATYDGTAKTASATVSPLTVTLDGGSGPKYTNNSLYPSLTGKVSPGFGAPTSTVTAVLGSQTRTDYLYFSSGEFSVGPFGLQPGSNTITVTASHPSGATSAPVLVTFVLDTQPPSAVATIDADVPTLIGRDSIDLHGSVSPYEGSVENADVAVNGQKVGWVAGDGSFHAWVTGLVEGVNDLLVTVRDRAGNDGPATHFLVTVNTRGLPPVFRNLGGTLASGAATWPQTLDARYVQTLLVSAQSGASLAGSRIEYWIDYVGGRPATAPAACPPQDSPSCFGDSSRIVPTHGVVDAAAPTASLTTPPLVAGLHTIYFAVTDTLGITAYRAAVLAVGPLTGSQTASGKDILSQPLASFGSPGVTTSRVPKLAGRIGAGLGPIDCGDLTGPATPTLYFWDPKGAGAWKPLPVKTSRNESGMFVVTLDPAALPQSKVPITTTSAGASVLRFRLVEGTMTAIGPQDTYGRPLCDGTTPVSDALLQNVLISGGDGGGLTGMYQFDLPYRAPSASDDPAPVIEVATPPSIIEPGTSPVPYDLVFRVSDLDADLDFFSVTVSDPGCGGAVSCTHSARLSGDQRASTTAPGGYFVVTLSIPVGTGTYTIKATDDAGHVTTKTVTISRILAPIEVRITRPTNNGGTFGLPNTGMVTFDASTSVNGGDPQTPLRFQWTRPKVVSGGVTTWELAASTAVYSELLPWASADYARRRVIVSSSAIPAPSPTIEAPCASAPGGQCGVAEVKYIVTCAPDGSLAVPARIVSPASGATFGLGSAVTVVGTAGDDSNPLIVYRWDLVNAATGQSVALPQAPGAAGDGYASANRVLSLDLASLTGLTAGAYRLTLSAGRAALEGGCVQGVATATANLTLESRHYSATGLAPGALVPGTTSLTLYGAGFDAAARISVAGPVYSLEDGQTSLCDLSAGQCATQTLAPTLAASGTQLHFNLPGSTASGYYLVWAADPAGPLSDGVWLEVQPAQATAPTKSTTFDGLTLPLTPGQAIDGQFLPARDPSGILWDKDYYYFFASAGSKVSLSLIRADASLPWEHPDALDPDLSLVAPDGIVYEGLRKADDIPASDLNASLTDVVLPQTGRWVVIAGTTKGSGGYRLAFDLTPSAVGPAEQLQPVDDRFSTAPAAGADTPTPSLSLPDARPISGARVQWLKAPEAGDSAGISFPSDGLAPTGTRAFSQATGTVTSLGTIGFRPGLLDSGVSATATSAASEPLLTGGGGAGVVSAGVAASANVQARREVEIPPAVAYVGVHLSSIDSWSGTMELTVDKPEKAEALPGQPEHVRRGAETSTRSSEPVAANGSAQPGRRSVTSRARRSAVTILEAPICSPSTFRALSVNGTVQGPFTLTLTDLTPKAGGTPGAEEVGPEGIRGHRVENTIDLKIAIKDGTGQEPTYPILVHLQVSGPASGLLALGEAEPTCPVLTFVWHERDAQGNLIALNDTIRYKLGTKAGFAGFMPDPGTPLGIKPVWAPAEYFIASLGAPRPQDGSFVNELTKGVPVRVQPGKADHFIRNASSLQPPGELHVASGYGFSAMPDGLHSNGLGYLNFLYLVDSFGNYVWGFQSASATSPGGGITADFSFQATSTSPAADSFAYQVSATWSKNPSWPSGRYRTTLTVSGQDVEHGTITVSYPLDLVFSTQRYSTYAAVVGFDGGLDLDLDTSRTPAVDLTLLSPEGGRKAADGTQGRTSILFFNADESPVSPWRVLEDSDFLVKDGTDSFDVALVDRLGRVMERAEYDATVCPHFDHREATYLQVDPRPCPANRTSQSGKVLGVTLNERGYLGLMITKAPAEPGTYYFKLTPAVATRTWTLEGAWAPEETIGFYACTVRAAEILDRDHMRPPSLLVNEPVQAFVRLLDPTTRDASVDLSVQTDDSKGLPVTSPVSVTVRRVGQSSVFMAPITLAPAGVPPASSLAALETSPLGPVLLTEFLHSKVRVFKGTKQLAEKLTKSEAELKIRWVDPKHPDDVSALQVTRIGRVPDPTAPGRILYTEDTLVRVEAVKPGTSTVIEEVEAVVRLDEAPSPDFRALDGQGTTTPDWRFSYQGERGIATNLHPGRQAPGDATAVALAHGRTEPFLLRSLAGPRSMGGDSRELTWDARLRACVALPQATCIDQEGQEGAARAVPRASVRQWVDDVSYGRHEPFSPSEPTDESNTVRDWLEANVWDAISDAPPRGGVIAEAVQLVAQIKAEANDNANQETAWSYVTPQERAAIVFKTHRFSTDALRWDSAFGDYRAAYGIGLNMEQTLSSITLHEARHCWQLRDAWMGGDGDRLPVHPEAADPGAMRLRDMNHYFLDGDWVSGTSAGNPEMDLLGEGISDESFGSVVSPWKAVRERDAYAFQVRASVGLPLRTAMLATLEGPLISPEAGEIALQVGGESAELSVTARAPSGVFGAFVSGPVPAVPVEIEVVPPQGGTSGGLVVAAGAATGLSSSGSRHVATTGPDGIARLVLRGHDAGDYQLRLWVRQLDWAGSSPGAALSGNEGGQTRVWTVKVRN